MNKRLFKELNGLIKQQSSRSLLSNDYLVWYDESNLNKVYSLIKCPYDSLYKHKFLRLDFDIPENYPHAPPTVTCLKYDTSRIHPNIYEDGKCCSTILNTWPSENEKWTSSMGIESIILAFMSFLDNTPYKHEPGGRDDPSYSVYVRYQSWSTLLLKYLQNEKIDIFIEYLYKYIQIHFDDILDELYTYKELYEMDWYYTPCFEIEFYYINFQDLIDLFVQYKMDIEIKDEFEKNVCLPIKNDKMCSICFETNKEHMIKIKCGHYFHEKCLELHMINNGKICSLCRQEIRDKDTRWIINPETNRLIKVNGPTYKKIKLD